MSKNYNFLQDGEMPAEQDLQYFEDVYTGEQKRHIPPLKATVQKAASNPYGYGNVVIYEPMTPEDVEMLIDFLRTREPAIVKLNTQREDIAQRILDMVSGAIFALNGSIFPIVENVFLLTPEGIEISAPAAK